MRSIRQASGALDALAKLMPDTAERIEKDGSTASVPVGQLQYRRYGFGAPGSQHSG